MGCLLAMVAGLFPRLGLLILWIARPVLVDAAFNTFILPLLGIIVPPFTTLIYVIVHPPGIGLTGWELFWVVLAALFDIGNWGPATASAPKSPGWGVSERGSARHGSARMRVVSGWRPG